MRDLFGNEIREPRAAPAPVAQLELIEAAAERLAYESGRPKSQERAEIIAGAEVPARGLLPRRDP